MSVLFVEGFTGVPRGSSSPMAVGSAYILSSLGWKGKGLYNGSSAVDPTDVNQVTAVEADPIFPSRNRLSIQANIGNTAVSSYIQAARMPLNTLGYTKFVIGMVFTAYSSTNSAGAFQFIVSGPTEWTTTGATVPDQYIGLNIPDNGADGYPWMLWGAAGTTTPLIKKGKATHLELFIEQDVGRIRAYLDGTLVGDASYSGVVASANGGFNVVLRTQAPLVSTYGVKVSDLYMLGVDAVHTGILGPGARVLEVAPQADFAVQWDRPTGFASNAAVLQQYNSGAPASYLTTGDVATDLYVGPDAVAANAATVYGAAMKAYGMTMAEGTHVLTAATHYQGTDGQSAATGNLVLSTMNNYVFDVSLNPKTGLKWTPSEISAAGIGIKLLS